MDMGKAFGTRESPKRITIVYRDSRYNDCVENVRIDQLALILQMGCDEAEIWI